MILGNKDSSPYSRSNMAIWMAMAFQAGLLNVGGFLAARTFVSHVTGYATLASVEMELGNLAHFIGLILMPTSFLLGAMVSGMLVDLKIKLKEKPKYYLVFGLLLALCLSVTLAGQGGFFGPFGQTSGSLQSYGLLALLCLICGIQNGAVTLVSRSIVRTTHLTGITTDLGIGLIRVFNRKQINEVNDEGKANLMRVGIIVFFMFGSLIGVPLFQRYEYQAFFLPCLISGCLFFTMLYFQRILPLIRARS